MKHQKHTHNLYIYIDIVTDRGTLVKLLYEAEFEEFVGFGILFS